MTTIIISEELSDTDAVLSALHHDFSWLLELSNSDPQSFVGRESELYDMINVLNWVTSRFSKVPPNPTFRWKRDRPQPDLTLDAHLIEIGRAMNGEVVG